MELKKVDLVTDDLVLNDKDMRLQLVDNFKIIQNCLNGIVEAFNLLETDDENSRNKMVTQEYLTEQLNEVTNRVNRIVVGSDEESIRLIVTQILQDKGVI